MDGRRQRLEARPVDDVLLGCHDEARRHDLPQTPPSGVALRPELEAPAAPEPSLGYVIVLDRCKQHFEARPVNYVRLQLHYHAQRHDLPSEPTPRRVVVVTPVK